MSDKLTVGQLFPNRPPVPLKPTQPPAGNDTGASFQSLLDHQLKVSHHAEMRLKQRGIDLKPEQLSKLNDAIDQAAAKGAKDSLVLMNNLAFIVNVPNRTIVTALDNSAMAGNVFTQIDSAVVVPN